MAQQAPATTTHPLPDVHFMKKAILAEISDVTEEDLNVMSVHQITSFFLQLKEACKGHPKQKHPNNEKDKIIDLASDCKDEDEEKSSQYYKPKFLSSNLYQIANNRLGIICGPPLQTTKEKMEAICSAYNPSIWATIRSLRPQEVEQTYERLRQTQIKEKFQLKQKDIKEKKFVIRVSKLEPPNQIFGISRPGKDEKKDLQKQRENGKNFTPSRDQTKDRTKKIKDPKLESTTKYKVKGNESMKKTSSQQNRIPTKTQIHIFKMDQLVQGDSDDEEITAVIRQREITQQNDFEDKLRKIKVQNVRRYLLEPGDNPQPEVIQCFQAIKDMLQSLDQIYQKKTDN